jgi:hypothetical protein
MANRRFIDFPIAASVGNNDIVLIWQDGLNKQTTKATLFAGSPNSLAGLTDVDISALANGQILQYNSTTSKWENVDRTDIDLDQLGDVTIVSPTNGQVLVYNSSTSKWENSSAGFVPYTGAVTTVNLGAQSILAGSFVKAGGTSAQFLKANGSVDSTAYGTGSVTSVALTMPSAFSVAGSPITTAGTLAVTGAGTVGQYVRGDGSLADFPATTGGGSSVGYYLNGSVSQGTIGGVAYREFNRNPVFGAGTDISISSNGYIANFITDAGDPNKLLIPAGNWNLETYFSASSNGGSPTFYVELYKYDGSTFTLIASSATSPELIAFGTNLNPYFSTLAVPQTTLALTDRLALRYYVNTSGRTITLHTENDHLCQVITTFTTGLTALNGLTAQVQFFAVGTSGTDFNIASSTDTHTFNLPTASATNRGALSSADWSLFTQAYNDKINSASVTGTTTKTLTLTQQDGGTITASWTDLNTDAVLSVFGRTGAVVAVSGDYTTAQVTESGNLYYTDGRARGALSFAAGSGAYNSSTGVITIPTNNNQITNGAGYITSAALSGYVQGTGTTNYLPKFTGASTIGNSQVFDNGTSVGIGVSPTTNKLEVGGSLTVGTGVTGNTDVRFNNAANGKIHYIFSDSASGELGLEAGASVGIKFNTNGANTRMAIFSDGNVTIGNSPSNAGFKLDVNGTGRFKVSTDRNLAIRYDTNITLSAQADSGGPENLRIYADTFRIYTATSAAGLTERFTISNTGAATFSSSVGVGISPSTKLHIASTVENIVTNEVLSGGQYAIYRLKNSSYTIDLGVDNTGLYLDGAAGSTRFFNGGGSAKMTITSGGNVLIGTTTDNAHKLQIGSTSSDRTSLSFSNTTTTRMYEVGLHGSSGTFPNRFFIFDDFANGYVFTIRASSVSRFHGPLETNELTSEGTTKLATISGNVLIGSISDSGGDRRLQVGGNLFVDDNATTGNGVQLKNADRPLITRGWDAFTSGNKTGVGRWGVYMESAELFIGSPGTDYTGGLVTIGGWLVNGTRQPNLTVNNQTRNVLIGTTTDSGHKLRVNGTTFTNELITLAPEAESISGAAWRFGTASIASITPNRRLRVKVGGVEYYIGAVEV